MPDSTHSSKRLIAVIDGNSLMHRAFHAVPPTMTSPDGRPTNAIFGFLSMFTKMIEIFNPDGVICVFDKGRPQVRIDILPQYKAQRPPMDPSLHEQFPVVKDLLRTMDIPVVELSGWEGDDLIGTLVTKGAAQGFDMYAITGDKDMYQLSRDDIKIVHTRKGMSDIAIMTPETVEKTYHGIAPELVPDYYGLKGDPSDNIPGVPGIGPKRACDLITKYGNLEGVIEHADEVKGKMGESLRAHIDDALVSRQVAIIRTDAPVDVEFESLHFPSWDADNVFGFMKALGFGGMTKRILAMSDAEVTAAPEFKMPDVLEGQEAEDKLTQLLDSDGWLGVDLKAFDHEKTLFNVEEELWDERDYMLHIASNDCILRFNDSQKVQDILITLIKKAKISAIDLKGIIEILCPKDSSKTCYLPESGLVSSRLFDCSIAAYLLDSSKGSYPWDQIAQTYLGIDVQEEKELELQGAAQASIAYRLRETLEEKLKQDGSYRCFAEIEMPLLPVLCKMERCGMYVDPELLKEQSQALGADINEIASQIHSLAGEDFNIDSPMQLSHVLFDVLGLSTEGLKKTKSGYYSTNAKVLDSLAQTNEVVAQVLDYREKTKIRSTYLDALPKLIMDDGRIHSSFNQTIAATGRLSSSDPNLQNIPVRSELGRHVRTAFTVPEDHVFLACDYSQIELRLLAHLSGDENLIRAFCEGADFHAATASRVFGVDIDQVTPELRSHAKAVNFGIVYGQQAFGLAQTLHIPRSEAQLMIDRYFNAYPGVREYLDKTVEFARKNQWVSTMYGRKRHVPDIASRNFSVRSFGERTAMNHPMQGSAADIIKIAMINVQRRLAEEKMASKLILQIHDELDLEVPVSELEEVQALVKDTMESVCELRVPLLAEASYGKTWAEAK